MFRNSYSCRQTSRPGGRFACRRPGLPTIVWATFKTLKRRLPLRLPHRAPFLRCCHRWRSRPTSIHGPALQGADLHGKPKYAKKLLLTDGGAYDNLGLETVDSFKTLLISDAGAPFSTQSDGDTLWHQQALRALDIATDQARALRKRHIFLQFSGSDRKLAFWGIDQDINTHAAPGGLPCPFKVTRKLGQIRTRLNKFSNREQGQLINWGYAATDNAVRNHILPNATAPRRMAIPGPRNCRDRVDTPTEGLYFREIKIEININLTYIHVSIK